MIMIHVAIRNESARKGFFRRDVLMRIAARACAQEDRAYPGTEVSLLFCDDPFIARLNRQYRNRRSATDVLSFAQDHASFHGAHVLGDVVISLETVERYCGGDKEAMRREVRLLFCHGLLHLLGHDHATAEGKAAMIAKQAQYLGVQPGQAWRDRSGVSARRAKEPAGGGASKTREK